MELNYLCRHGVLSRSCYELCFLLLNFNPISFTYVIPFCTTDDIRLIPPHSASQATADRCCCRCRCRCRCRCCCFTVKPASLFPVNRPPSFSSFSTMLSKSAPTTAGSAARSARASQRSLAREIAHRATLKQLLCKKHNIGDVLAEAVIKLFESRV